MAYSKSGYILLRQQERGCQHTNFEGSQLSPQYSQKRSNRKHRVRRTVTLREQSTTSPCNGTSQVRTLLPLYSHLLSCPQFYQGSMSGGKRDNGEGGAAQWRKREKIGGYLPLNNFNIHHYVKLKLATKVDYRTFQHLGRIRQARDYLNYVQRAGKKIDLLKNFIWLVLTNHSLISTHTYVCLNEWVTEGMNE